MGFLHMYLKKHPRLDYLFITFEPLEIIDQSRCRNDATPHQCAVVGLEQVDY